MERRMMMDYWNLSAMMMKMLMIQVKVFLVWEEEVVEMVVVVVVE
jgi:hypothetical protein